MSTQLVKQIVLLIVFLGSIALISSVFYIPEIYCSIPDSSNKIIIYGKAYDKNQVLANHPDPKPGILSDTNANAPLDLSRYFYPTLDWEDACPGITNPGSVLWDNILDPGTPIHRVSQLSRYASQDYILSTDDSNTNNEFTLEIYNKVYDVSSYFRNEIRIFDPNMDIIFSKRYNNNTEIMEYLLEQDPLYYDNVLNCMNNLFLVGTLQGECEYTRILYMVFSSIFLCTLVTLIILLFINVKLPKYDGESMPLTGYLLHVSYDEYFAPNAPTDESTDMSLKNLIKYNTVTLLGACLGDLHKKVIIVTIKYNVLTDYILDIYQVPKDIRQNQDNDDFIQNGNERVKMYTIQIDNINVVILVDYSECHVNWQSNLVQYVTSTTNISDIGYHLQRKLLFKPTLYYWVSPYLEIKNFKCLKIMSDQFIMDETIIGVSMNNVIYENDNIITRYERLYANSCQKVKSIWGKSDIYGEMYGYRLFVSNNVLFDIQTSHHIHDSTIFNRLLWSNKPTCKTKSLNKDTLGITYKPKEFIKLSHVWNEHGDVYSIFKMMFALSSIFFWYLVYQNIVTSKFDEYSICIILMGALLIILVNRIYLQVDWIYQKSQVVKGYFIFWIYSIIRGLLAPIIYIAVLIYSMATSSMVTSKKVPNGSTKPIESSEYQFNQADEYYHFQDQQSPLLENDTILRYYQGQSPPPKSKLPDIPRDTPSISSSTSLPNMKRETPLKVQFTESSSTKGIPSTRSTSTGTNEINLDKKVVLSRKDMGYAQPRESYRQSKDEFDVLQNYLHS